MRRSAPVNAPFSWPNSSLSSSVSVNAAQLSLTNGAAARGDTACSRDANTSLPTPVSPSSSTLTPPAATRISSSCSRRIVGDSMTRSPVRSSRGSGSSARHAAANSSSAELPSCGMHRDAERRGPSSASEPARDLRGELRGRRRLGVDEQHLVFARRVARHHVAGTHDLEDRFDHVVVVVRRSGSESPRGAMRLRRARATSSCRRASKCSWVRSWRSRSWLSTPRTTHTTEPTSKNSPAARSTRRCGASRCAVQERSVRASEILELQRVPDVQGGVAPRDRDVVDPDLGAVAAADRQRATARQLDPLRSCFRHHDQLEARRHLTLVRSCLRLGIHDRRT